MKTSDENVGDGSDVVVALRLMRLALAPLDRAGQGLAAARLQHAIDAVQGASPAVLHDEHDPDVLERIVEDGEV